MLAALVGLLSPLAVDACIYPAPLRVVNAVMLGALDGDGSLTRSQRIRLQRAMTQLDPQALQGALRGEVSRGERAEIAQILRAAGALANSTGFAVSPDLRAPLNRLRGAVSDICATEDAVGAGAGEVATDAERGLTRSTGNGGQPLTFSEGVMRLSLTFTIYMTFLAFLLGVRRIVKHREADAMAPLSRDPAERAPPEILRPAVVQPSPTAPEGATPPLR